PPTSLPEDVPAGWQRYDGISCRFPLYIQGAKGIPLPHIEWEPCPAPIPADLGCRRIKAGWGFAGEGQISVYPRFWRDGTTGKSFIEVNRADRPTDRIFLIVTELDGSVRVAFLQRRYSSSVTFGGPDAIADGRYVFGVVGGEIDGFIGGRIGEAYPRVAYAGTHQTRWYSNWAASEGWIVRFNAFVSKTAWNPILVEEIPLPGSVGGGLEPHLGFGVGKDIFWEVGSQDLSGVVSWSMAEGARSLLVWPNDPLHSAGNFGTDGQEMAWTYADQRDSATGEWSRVSVMTGPYTTDPEQLKTTARRLRSDFGSFSPYPYHVGCGYAARVIGMNQSFALFIVRLRDGVSWIIPDGQQTGSWRFGLASIGIACNTAGEQVEVLSTFYGPETWAQRVTMVRIPLANLGPGLPPD
ncbi:MAG: hypothetical protein HY901_10895, partial [Deltaproteobacteria bacterium]|nr:hypothetical protein [Deltaproteobacteria bacterium]